MWPWSSAYRAVSSTVFVNTVTSGAILHRGEARGRTDNTPCPLHERKRSKPFPEPCISSLLCSDGGLPPVPVVTNWCRQWWWVSDLSGQGWAEREREQPRAEQPGRSACLPPRDPQETPQLQPLRCTGKGSHRPPGGSPKGAAPSVTLSQPNLGKRPSAWLKALN